MSGITAPKATVGSVSVCIRPERISSDDADDFTHPSDQSSIDALSLSWPSLSPVGNQHPSHLSHPARFTKRRVF